MKRPSNCPIVRDIRTNEDGHIGRCEVFITSILQKNGLDFVKVPRTELTKYSDLVFPPLPLVTKSPAKLRQVRPPKPVQTDWLQICLINENYKADDKDCDMKGRYAV